MAVLLCSKVYSLDQEDNGKFISSKVKCAEIILFSLLLDLFQALPDLIRINRQGNRVSSNLGDFVKFNCDGTGKDRKCHSNIKFGELATDIKTGSSSDDSIVSYLEVIIHIEDDICGL